MSDRDNNTGPGFRELMRAAEASAHAEGGAALAWYEEWAEAFEEATAAGDQSGVDCFTDLLIAWHSWRTTEPERPRSVADVVRSLGFQRFGQ